MIYARTFVDANPSLAQSTQRGDKVQWNEDNPHYTNPPEGWPPTNIDMIPKKNPAGLLGKLWKARPWKWIIQPNELGRVEYPVGTIPEYTIDVTSNGGLVDVIYGFSVYSDSPSQEIPIFGGTFEIGGLQNSLFGNNASGSPYSVNFQSALNPVIVIQPDPSSFNSLLWPDD